MDLAEQSKPTIFGFSPDVIPYQRKVVDLIRTDFDYSKGNLEVLLSGSYGSAKSALMAHLVSTHCLLNPGARACLGREAMPDLKRTIFREILDHISVDLVEGRDFWVNTTQAIIVFRNGSEIISTSWADRKYSKARSLKLSCVCIEELTESDAEGRAAFMELKARVRRIPGIKENFVIAATNPDSPGHWAYDYFIKPAMAGHPTRRVFYSKTYDNPFLDPVYIEQLRADLNEREVKRYIEGQWIELTKDVVYWAYSADGNYRDTSYKVDETHPIGVAFDFNIADGKPLSCCLFQYVDGVFHYFAEAVVEGLRTLDICEELGARGFLDFNTEYLVYGDATGARRDTRSKVSDYDIIMGFLQNYAGGKLRVRKLVPLSNPPIRDRHNRVNAYCCNADGERRLFVYRDAPTLDKGLRLTALKKGGTYIEDDSQAFQHVTTAAAYGLMTTLVHANRQPQRSREL